MPALNTDTILIAFVGLTAVAVLLQAIVLFSIYAAVRKAVSSLQEATEDFNDSVMPVLKTTRTILETIAPKVAPVVADVTGISANIKTASAELAEMAHTLRVQSADVQLAAADALDRVRRQTGRVDGMVTDALNTVDQAADFVQRAVSTPIRKLAGMIAAVKAMVESFRASERRH